MIQFREFLDLTDDEIRFILSDIFCPVKIENIKRCPKWNLITAEITTSGWDDGSGDTFDITDEVELSLQGINVNFSLDSDDILKYNQFLIAKGCDYRLKNNPYMDI